MKLFAEMTTYHLSWSTCSNRIEARSRMELLQLQRSCHCKDMLLRCMLLMPQLCTL